MDVIKAWFRRSFSNPQVVILALLLVLGFASILLLGHMLIPVVAAAIIAYLLESPVLFLGRRGLPRLASVLLVFSTFMAFAGFVIIALLPLVFRQGVSLVQALPEMIRTTQKAMMSLTELYPEVFSEAQIGELMGVFQHQLTSVAEDVVSLSLASVIGIATVAVYTVLVPLLVFFFLKDKLVLLEWFSRFLPSQRALAVQVWHEVDQQIGNYVRGKFFEILVVSVVTYIAFLILGLDYALLLGLFVGLSVLIPYVGATLMTVPVVLVAYFQWGTESEMVWTVVVYFIIQALDGNLLVPIVFSEAVKLHPVAIIVAILLFGGLWGFWGVFFAIPLATLVRAVLEAWPKPKRTEDENPDEEAAVAA